MKVPAARGQTGLTLMEVLIALVVVSIGVGLFMTLQKNSGSWLAGNSKLLRAGQLVEREMEAIRIGVARDTIGNWPPRDTSFKDNRITLVRTISQARSPKTNLLLPNVRKVDIVTSWGPGQNDSLRISTYVAKRL